VARIAVFGAGYVGLVTAAGLADLGNDVVVRDVVPEKIEGLGRGEVPIHEPGLDELLNRNRERLRFTLDVTEAVEGSEFVFIAVGTPPTYSGDADLSAVWTVVDELPHVAGRPVLVMKSTVPVGTGEKVRAALDQRGLSHAGYVANPEFTAEGRAVRDFMEPDRIVVGAFDEEDGDRVARLHARIDAPIVRTDVNSAEMIKLASNAFLSTRISFINEIANVCELVGADVEKVAEGMGLDHRLGPHFLQAGVGFGGSCLDGRETVMVRLAGRRWVTSMEQLHELAREGLPLEILSWGPGEAPYFAPVAAVTRRAGEGEVIELSTKMGRRLLCTTDHPIVTRTGLKAADDVDADDWVPLALGAPPPEHAARFDLLEDLSAAGVTEDRVIARAGVAAVAGLSVAAVRARLPELPPSRPSEMLRKGVMRLSELDALELSSEDVAVATVRNGTYVPTSVPQDERFWRIVGLYIAEGHVSADGRRRRIEWSFHPYDEMELVDEVAGFWRSLGVKCDVRRAATTMRVVVSSRILAGWWLGVLGLGANCYEQRIPDAAWGAPEQHKRALLSGAWRGDGSWSLVGGGPSVVLEYGTASRELADGLLRLLGELGVVARLKIRRTAKSTCDNYWLVVSGANQVEQLLDLVSDVDRRVISASIAKQAKRISPTGYYKDLGAAWVRVVDVQRRPSQSDVYSVEVPTSGTFVTTGGLVVHNCFPKDVSALKQLAGNSGYHFQLLSAVIEVNELQKRRLIGKLQKHLGRLRGRRIALLGLAFKPGTDDMREAPSLVLASRLIAEGAEVRAWDPVADGRAVLPEATVCESVEDAVRGADAAVIVTEWPELQSLARPEIRELMARPLIVDGRNLLDPEQARAAGFAYEGIGRPVSPLDVLPETAEREPELET
jgi:UDPglucose 6-dehydrogenase